jgi:hypothetical protein
MFVEAYGNKAYRRVVLDVDPENTVVRMLMAAFNELCEITEEDTDVEGYLDN